MLYKLYLSLLKKYGEQHWWPAETKDEIIIGAILTQNAAWNNVEKAIKNLKEKNVCSIKGIVGTDIKSLEILIKPSGFYKQKAKRLKNFSCYLIENYGENFIEKMNNKETRELRNELLGINGLGKETVDSILLYVFERPVFVIDAYTRRIYNALFDTDEGSKMKYDELREKFERNLIEKFESETKGGRNNEKEIVKIYNEYHALIVRFGKENKKDYKSALKEILS